MDRIQVESDGDGCKHYDRKYERESGDWEYSWSWNETESWDEESTPGSTPGTFPIQEKGFKVLKFQTRNPEANGLDYESNPGPTVNSPRGNSPGALLGNFILTSRAATRSGTAF